MNFGDILRELIETNNLTQKELGAQLNIAPSTLGNYVRNIREPDHSTLIMFAKYFDVSTDYLLGYSNEEAISHSEQLLINTYRKLSPEYRHILIKQAQVLFDAQAKKNFHN